MKKRLFALVIALVITTSLLCGCAAQGVQAPSKSDTLKVALIMSGLISDQGWNAAAYSGLKSIESELGCEISYLESVTKQDMESAFRNYASKDFNVVFAHGFEFADAAKAVAKEFTNTKFIVTSCDAAQEPNVGSIAVSNYEVGFLLGTVGCVYSKSGKIGALNSMEVPQIAEAIKGMKAAISFVKPEVELISAYTGSMDDVGKAREMAGAMIEKGVDIIQGDPNQMSFGIMDACAEKNAMFMGVISDFSSANPDVVLTSGLGNYGKAMVEAIKSIQDGSWKPAMREFGIKEDVVVLAPYGACEDKLTKEEKEKIQSIIEKVKKGEIDIYALGK